MSDPNTNANPNSARTAGAHFSQPLMRAQIARILAHGKKRAVQAGEVLVEPGSPLTLIFLSSWSHRVQSKSCDLRCRRS